MASIFWLTLTRSRWLYEQTICVCASSRTLLQIERNQVRLEIAKKPFSCRIFGVYFYFLRIFLNLTWMRFKSASKRFHAIVCRRYSIQLGIHGYTPSHSFGHHLTNSLNCRKSKKYHEENTHQRKNHLHGLKSNTNEEQKSYFWEKAY